jgi:hypothetical protein
MAKWMEAPDQGGWWWLRWSSKDDPWPLFVDAAMLKKYQAAPNGQWQGPITPPEMEEKDAIAYSPYPCAVRDILR